MTRLVTKSLIWSLGLILSVHAFSAICFAESNPGTVGPNGSPDLPGVGAMDTFKMIFQVIFFLIVIIGLFLIIIKFLSKKNKFFSMGRSFRSLGGVPLGTNKSVQIVQLGNALYVIGVGENVQLLEKIDRPEDVESIKEMLSGPMKSGQDFSSITEWFRRIKGKREEDETEDIASFQQVFLNKMQNVTNRKKMVEDLLMENQKKDRLNDKE